MEFAKIEDLSGPKSSTAIAVHPVNPEILAVGYAGAALSTDGGNRWITLTDLEGWHSDIHRLWFHLEPAIRTPKGSPPRPRRYSLYIPSDGGILRWTGADNNSSLATIPTRADSSRNRTLPIVMLYAPDKAFTKAFGNIAVAGSVIAAGSQDNANLWFDVGDPVWRRVSSTRGDGGAVALSNAGNNLTILHSQSTNKVPLRAAHRANSAAWGNSTVVPLRLSPTALDATGILPAFLRPVTRGVGLAAGAGSSPVIALASVDKSNVIYAAIIRTILDQAGALISQEVEWIIFGRLPTGEIASCLEAHNNTSVLVGTESGKIFLVKENLSPSAVSFNHKPNHAIKGIASSGKTIACFATSRFSIDSQSTLYMGHFRDRSVPPTTKRWFDLHRVETSAFARNDGSATFHSICANRSQRNTTLSFALTADPNEVWVCLSDLSRWRKAVAGLPHDICCSDVVFSDSVNGGELLLSSYGRAVWRLVL